MSAQVHKLLLLPRPLEPFVKRPWYFYDFFCSLGAAILIAVPHVINNFFIILFDMVSLI